MGPEKARNSLKVSFFDVTEGIDPGLIEILNMKLADVSK